MEVYSWQNNPKLSIKTSIIDYSWFLFTIFTIIDCIYIYSYKQLISPCFIVGRACPEAATSLKTRIILAAFAPIRAVLGEGP